MDISWILMDDGCLCSWFWGFGVDFLKNLQGKVLNKTGKMWVYPDVVHSFLFVVSCILCVIILLTVICVWYLWHDNQMSIGNMNSIKSINCYGCTDCPYFYACILWSHCTLDTTSAGIVNYTSVSALYYPLLDISTSMYKGAEPIKQYELSFDGTCIPEDHLCAQVLTNPVNVQEYHHQYSVSSGFSPPTSSSSFQIWQAFSIRSQQASDIVQLPSCSPVPMQQLRWVWTGQSLALIAHVHPYGYGPISTFWWMVAPWEMMKKAVAAIWFQGEKCCNLPMEWWVSSSENSVKPEVCGQGLLRESSQI